VVFFSGSRARTKITKICEAFGANRYPFPEEPNRLWQMKSEVDERLSELQSTLDAGIYHRNNVLNNIGYSLEKWTLMVKKEKAVYHTLNMLSVDVTRKCLVAEAWCPVSAKPKVKQQLPPQVLDKKTPVYFVCVITSQNSYMLIPHPTKS
jgi:V-type H+-transporting ATPase subunit a